MKALKSIKILGASILGSLMLVSLGVDAQEEYDDMYFTPKDRKEVKSESVFTSSKYTDNTSRDVVNPSYNSRDYGEADENYSAKNVNPEYIERYKTNSKENYAEETTEGDAYYVEDYNRAEMPDKNTERAIRNYNYNYFGPNYGFGNNWMSPYHRSPFHDPFYDPFWDPYSFPSYGYARPMGFRPGFNWSMSFTFGNSWGYSPWSYYPYGGFQRPYYGSAWAYDGWYSSFHSPFYRPWRSSYYSGYNSGFYTGYYYGHRDLGFAKSYDYNTRVRRGANNIQVSENNNVPGRRVSVTQQNPDRRDQNINARARSDRDYSRVQNEYYNRSDLRYADRTSENARVSTNARSGSAVNGTTAPRVRSSRTTTDYSSRPSYRNSNTESRSRSTYSNSSQRRSSSWSNDNYKQRNRSSSGSYSTPSRSRSSYSGNSSSGSSSRPSYSAPSRSSSGSSGTRSSSGSSSRSRR